jgi:hypothetical protein
MRLRTLSGSIQSPAAGAGFAFTWSPIQRVKLESLRFTFTASAVVANRLIVAQLLDPNGISVFETGSTTAVAASGASDYVVSPAFGTPAPMQGPVNVAVGLAWPAFWLPPAWQVKVSVVAIDVGDTFSNIAWAAHFGEDAWNKDLDERAFHQLVNALG